MSDLKNANLAQKIFFQNSTKDRMTDFNIWVAVNCLRDNNPSKHSSSRRLDQGEYVRLSLTSSEDVFKMSWSRPIYSS